ncbi:hypothetical protein CEXT_525491, partial [Caerostris extrusa]
MSDIPVRKHSPVRHFISSRHPESGASESSLKQPSYRSPSSILLSSLRLHGNGIDRSSTRQITMETPLVAKHAPAT